MNRPFSTSNGTLVVELQACKPDTIVLLANSDRRIKEITFNSKFKKSDCAFLGLN